MQAELSVLMFVAWDLLRILGLHHLIFRFCRWELVLSTQCLYGSLTWSQVLDDICSFLVDHYSFAYRLRL